MSTAGPRSATPGQTWAYRKRGIDPLAEVEVIRQGRRRPPRVLVRFVDDEFEGHEEWVPPARLKVPWGEVEEFRGREHRWNRIREVGIDDNDTRWDAADVIFTELIDSADARLDYREGGASRISNLLRLSDSLGLDSGELHHPVSFSESGETVVPWAVTEVIVTAAARANPRPVLEYVRREEAQARHAAVYGRHLSGRGNYYIKPEICIETDSDLTHPVLEHLRRYCGDTASVEFDEIAALRAEIRRVHAVAEGALAALPDSGEKRAANSLRKALAASPIANYPSLSSEC